MDFLSSDSIKVNLESRTKAEVVEELVDLLVAAGNVSNKNAAIKVLLDREELGSTGIGQGVAIPHAKSDAVKELVAAFGLSKSGIDFDALDGEPVNIFFLLLAPEEAAGNHLKALARISSLLKDKHFRRALLSAKTREEAIKVIEEEEHLVQ
jgi:fructose-specific phosphotransferase system IIA component